MTNDDLSPPQVLDFECTRSFPIGKAGVVPALHGNPRMSIEDNRRIALSFFERCDAGDISAMLDLLAEDITYWLAGKPGSMPRRARAPRAKWPTFSAAWRPP
jgi:hypothetical protein